MAKKRKPAPLRGAERDGEQKATPAPERVFASPFKDLKKLLAGRDLSAAPSKPKAAPAPLPVVEKPAAPVAEPLDDESFLRHAFEGVRPLHANGKRNARIPLDPPTTH